MKPEIHEKIERLVAAETLSEGDVLQLLTLCRKLLEDLRADVLQEYGTLRLYADWMVHTKIDRSEGGASLVLDAHNVILDHLHQNDNSTFAADLTAALSLGKVRSEANALLSVTGAGNDMISSQTWGQVMPVIAEIISHTPLQIGSGARFDKYRNALAQRPTKDGSVVEELVVVKEPGSAFKNRDPNVIVYCIKIRLSNGVSIITPLV